MSRRIPYFIIGTAFDECTARVVAKQWFLDCGIGHGRARQNINRSEFVRTPQAGPSAPPYVRVSPLAGQVKDCIKSGLEYAFDAYVEELPEFASEHVFRDWGRISRMSAQELIQEGIELAERAPAGWAESLY